ncbi:MAG: hypothetical protein FWF66_03575 [Candidatus Bathyarchaeota archaeon]|nr:hypothetical protein [Candidatus Termiticorpusculum sp.]MCL1970520.1 hypothetical protein [Candidatus Termiticorpusculum sp.]
MSGSGEGVVNVQISVDKSEIDAALASIDSAQTGRVYLLDRAGCGSQSL